MTAVGQLVQSEDFDGPMNMAIDELLWIASGDGTPRLRLYGWADRPSLSLGYFQSSHEVRSVASWCDLPFVRRVTGGGAIIHDDDLTYSLAVPTPLAPRSGELYDRLHHAIAAELRGVGIPAVVGDSPTAGDRADRLCFLRSDRFALRVGQFKILGSAQRRRSASVLVQGSLLQAASSTAPEIPGLQELTGHPVDRRQVSQAIVHAAQTTFRLDFQPVELSPDLRRQASQLAAEKYRSPAWNEQR